MKRAGLAVVVTSLLGAAQVRAADASSATEKSFAALSFRRPEGATGCPSLGELARRVEAHLGRKGLVSAAEANMFIDATIEAASPRGFRAKITLSNQAEQVLGVRELEQETPDCGEVAESTALAIALMIDPNAGQPPGDATAPAPVASVPAEAVKAPVAACPEPKRVVEPEQRPSARLPWRARVLLGPLAALGQLPTVGWGVLGSVRLSPQRRVVGIDAGGFYLANAQSELRAGAGGKFTAAAASLAGWWAPWRSNQLAVSFGAGAQLGRIAARGFGFTARTDYAESWLLNAVVDADVAWTAWAPWGFVARASLGAPLWRDTYEAVQAGESQVVFKPAAVVGFVSLGVSFEP